MIGKEEKEKVKLRNDVVERRKSKGGKWKRDREIDLKIKRERYFRKNLS